jgi:hypothetical protein
MIVLAWAVIACRGNDDERALVVRPDPETTSRASAAPTPTPHRRRARVSPPSAPVCKAPWFETRFSHPLFENAAIVVMEPLCCPPGSAAGSTRGWFDFSAAHRLLDTLASECPRPPGEPVGEIHVVFDGGGRVADAYTTGYSPAATTCLRAKIPRLRVAPFDHPCQPYCARVDLTK